MDPHLDPFNMIDSAFIRERRFKELVKILKYESRFVLPEPYKSFVNSITIFINERYASIVPAGSIFYRGRINDIDLQDPKKRRLLTLLREWDLLQTN